MHGDLIDHALGPYWRLFRFASKGFAPRAEEPVIEEGACGRSAATGATLAGALKECDVVWIFPTHVGRNDSVALEQNFLTFCQQTVSSQSVRVVGILAVQAPVRAAL